METLTFAQRLEPDAARNRGYAVWMHQRRRNLAQIEKAAEQLERERAAPRLCEVAPTLVSLRMTFEDVTGEDAIGNVKYAKPIVVATAPAYFDVRCADPRCDGRHDLTNAVLSLLRARGATSSGRSPCNGYVGDASCSRALKYVCEATYRT